MSQSLNLLAVFFWKVFIDSHISKPLISREWLNSTFTGFR